MPSENFCFRLLGGWFSVVSGMLREGQRCRDVPFEANKISVAGFRSFDIEIEGGRSMVVTVSLDCLIQINDNCAGTERLSRVCTSVVV